jgi:O-acetyl-ADP-ribose deacetylase (regulator of RNase III)
MNARKPVMKILTIGLCLMTSLAALAQSPERWDLPLDPRDWKLAAENREGRLTERIYVAPGESEYFWNEKIVIGHQRLAFSPDDYLTGFLEFLNEHCRPYKVKPLQQEPSEVFLQWEGDCRITGQQFEYRRVVARQGRRACPRLCRQDQPPLRGEAPGLAGHPARSEIEVTASRLQVVQVVTGDITRLAVDAIVNAANESLLGGGGVDGAIHRAAGPELLALPHPGRLPDRPGEITPGFRLPAKHVIHTVGPVWHGGGHGEAASAGSCYRHCFRLAKEHGLAQHRLPGHQLRRLWLSARAAARIAVTECRAALAANPRLERVLLVAFDEAMAALLRQAAGISA